MVKIPLADSDTDSYKTQYTDVEFNYRNLAQNPYYGAIMASMETSMKDNFAEQSDLTLELDQAIASLSEFDDTL